MRFMLRAISETANLGNRSNKVSLSVLLFAWMDIAWHNYFRANFLLSGWVPQERLNDRGDMFNILILPKDVVDMLEIWIYWQ